MPELPEVETIARGLAKRVSGDVIESIWLGEKPEPLKSPAHEIAAALQNTRILTVRRMGKHIVFDLARVEPTPPSAKAQKLKPLSKKTKLPEAPPTAQFIVHLGMSGRLQLCEPQSEIAKHTHAILTLASGR
ncbi:MAG: DNA-formamidopyrimidine glycosylase family protein, partial [Candidatus Sulfotelmatobacter sp.]